MAIIFTFWPSTSQNKLSFTVCSIHVLFNSNEFHKFWMSFDFRSRCTKNEQIWAKTQTDRPLLGRPAWHPHTHCHVFNPGARSCTQVSLSRGMDVGLIEWTERLAQGSKDPPFSANACPCHQSNSLGDHKHPLAMTVQWRAEESQREAGRPSTCSS